MTPEQILEAINKGIAEAIKPITSQVASLVEQVKPVAELQKQVAAVVEADSAREIEGKNKPAEKKGAEASAAGAALTAESVKGLIAESLKAHTQTQNQTAQQQAQHEAWIKKHAPKMAGSPTANRIFAGATTDEQRKAALDEYIADLKASGVKAPDLGASAAGEGGQPADAAASEEAKKAAALEAAGKIKPVTL